MAFYYKTFLQFFLDVERVCCLLVRSGPGAAWTILLFHTISARPSKQPRMVGGTVGVYSFGLIFVFLQEQIKDIIIIIIEHRRGIPSLRYLAFLGIDIRRGRHSLPSQCCRWWMGLFWIEGKWMDLCCIEGVEGGIHQGFSGICPTFLLARWRSESRC